MSSVINGYALIGEFTTADAGMCRWSFARKDNHEYFIKEFLSPKYPTDTEKLGPELTAIMRGHAEEFFRKKQEYYDKIRCCRTGNIMVPLEFFRSGSKYYEVTDKVSGRLLDVSEVAKLPDDQKLTLIKSLLYSMAQLHRQSIVHSDLKPENILIKATADGFCTAKIIDFDAGFFENDVPENIEGSQNYFSPETLLRINGQDVPVTTKADVFALGLLMHQYWCGSLPTIPDAHYYVFEAVLAGDPVRLNPEIPEELRTIIGQMLSRDAEQRPTAEAVWQQLRGTPAAPAKGRDNPKPAPKKETFRSGFSVPSDDELD